MIIFKRTAWVALACSAFTLSAHASTWTAELTPGASISGNAGDTIGWGYSITNESSTDWLMLTNLAEDPFQHVSSLDDVFDFPIIAPGATVSADYVIGSSGLLGLTWAGDAPLSFVNSGSILLSADWYNGNPLLGGVDLGSAGQSNLTYAAQVAPVPLPSALWLAISGMVPLIRIVRQRS